MATRAEMAVEAQRGEVSVRASGESQRGYNRGVPGDTGVQPQAGEARTSMEPMIEIRKLSLKYLVEGVTITGKIRIGGTDINDPNLEITELRKRVGMVFQKSNPFPKTIYDNAAYGPRIQGLHSRSAMDEIVERSLRGAALWDEVRDRLQESALSLSGGQQQRLCIARAIAVEPDVLLMDEPCSALDPIATAKIEELIAQLKKQSTIVIVTHNMQQAARVSDYTAFLYLGTLIEYDLTKQIFVNPSKKQTEDYITGRFG